MLDGFALSLRLSLSLSVSLSQTLDSLAVNSSRILDTDLVSFLYFWLSHTINFFQKKKKKHSLKGRVAG